MTTFCGKGKIIMKRILSFVLLLLVFALTFTSCEWFNQQQPQPEVTYDVNLGMNALKGNYQVWNTNNKITVDTNLVGQVQYRGVFYKVTWAAESEAVTLTANEDGTTKLAITRGTADVNFSLVATVSTPDGKESLAHTFELVIPAAIDGMSHADYIAAEKDAEVEIVGVVTYVNSKAAGDSKNFMYLEDLEGKGGYYVYSFAGGVDGVAENGIKVGMTVKVSGTKDIYNGTHEVKDATVTVLDTSIKNLTVFDITDKYIAAADAKDTAIVNYLGAVVTIKGIEITDYNDGTDKYYYNFKLDGVESYIRLALSCGLPEEVLNAMKVEHIAHKGGTANITGLVNVYNGAFYLIPISADALEYLEAGCEHNYATEVTAPTCTAKGYTTHTCSLCGASYKDSEVDMLEHNWTDTTACTNGCGENKPSGTVLLTGTFNNAVPSNLTYITNNTNYPNPSWYSNGGLKMSYVNQGVSTATFAAQSSVKVTLTFSVLNPNEKTQNDKDAFTFYGLDANGNVVATVTTDTITDLKASVVLSGEGIVSVKVIMTDYYSDGTVCYNLNLVTVTVEAQ
jgi:hypothetical protein